MNLVFMNSFEKEVADGLVWHAYVSICENNGQWHLFWNEQNEQGKTEQQVWYEGDSWQQMIGQFKEQLKLQTANGYHPLLAGWSELSENQSSKMKFVQMLEYYSEQHSDEALYEQLRAWRREKAVQDQITPYIIATNRLLRLISTFVPKTMEQLKQIPGFGPRRLEQYGRAILQLTEQSERTSAFPLDWVAGHIDDAAFDRWTKEQKEKKIKEELDKQTLKRTILGLIQNGAALDAMQESVDLSRRDLVMWIEQIEKEGYDVDSVVQSELEKIPEEEKKSAWQAFEAEGDQYLKPVLQKVYQGEQLEQLDAGAAYEWLRLLRIQFRRERKQTKAS